MIKLEYKATEKELLIVSVIEMLARNASGSKTNIATPACFENSLLCLFGGITRSGYDGLVAWCVVEI